MTSVQAVEKVVVAKVTRERGEGQHFKKWGYVYPPQVLEGSQGVHKMKEKVTKKEHPCKNALKRINMFTHEFIPSNTFHYP